MTRRIWSAALALTLAGGVYLAGAPAQASNMGFKLERDFDYKRTSAAGNRGLINIYFVGFPYFNGLGDVAGTPVPPSTNPCVGDVGGPLAGDGNLDVNDAMCDFWVVRSAPGQSPGNYPGSFSMSYYDTATCSIKSRLARIVLGNVQFSLNTFPAAGTDLWTDIGYQINVGASTGTFPDQRNRVVIVGSHDPAFAGHQIRYSPTCGAGGPPCCNAATAARIDLISVPYHTMFGYSVELLCGLRGVDWPDANNDFRPDDGICDGGISDQTRPITVQTVKNDDPATGGISGYVSQQARYALMVLTLAPPTPFALIPGEAYQVNIAANHVTTTFLSPHF